MSYEIMSSINLRYEEIASLKLLFQKSFSFLSISKLPLKELQCHFQTIVRPWLGTRNTQTGNQTLENLPGA